MDAWKTYRSLNPEQKQILAQKQLDIERPVDELLALLKPLAACDSIANKSQTRFGCTFGILIVVAFAAVILFSNIGWNAVTFGIFLLLVVTAVASGWFWRWLASIDVSNNLRQFVVPVLALFREDIDPRTPMHLRLDLTKPNAAPKKVSEGKPFAHGVYRRIVDTMYVDPWMSAEAVLVDGTRLRWSVTDKIRERKKTKSNARGKTKTKTKYRKITDLEVQLAMKTKTYTLAEAEVSSDGKRSKVDVQRSVRTDSLDPVDPRALIDAITGVYRSLKPAKEAHA